MEERGPKMVGGNEVWMQIFTRSVALDGEGPSFVKRVCVAVRLEECYIWSWTIGSVFDFAKFFA